MTNIDSHNYKQENPLLNLEDRMFEFKKQHNTGFLTFLGFLITSIGVIISVDSVSICVKHCLCISIILLVAGLTIFFYISSLEPKKIDKSINYMRKRNLSDELGDLNEEIEILNKIRKKTKREKILNLISKICLYCGIFSFLFGIILFMNSL